MAVPVLPDHLLNLKVLALCDAVIGGLCIIFQVVSFIALYTDKIGVGFWGGIIFLLTSASVLQLSTKGGSGWLLGLAHLLAGQAVLVGLLLLGWEAHVVDVFSGTGYPTVLAMSVLLMILGAIGFFINVIISYALILRYLSANNVAPPTVTT